MCDIVLQEGQMEDDRINLSQFIEQYYFLLRQIHEDFEELTLRIKDSEKRVEMMQTRLSELVGKEKKTKYVHPARPGRHIMQGSMLNLLVIDARDLVPQQRGRYASSQVRVEIENQVQKTQEIAQTNDPVWNEMLTFDIRTGQDKLKI